LQERRRARRLPLDRRVRVKTIQQGKEVRIHGWTRDISADGLGAVVPCSMALDERVTLEFSVDGAKEGTATAYVRHRQGFYYGFDFLTVDAALREAIEQAVEKVEQRVG